MNIIDKITGMIFGLFGSIIAGFCVSLITSFLTDNQWTILLAGFIIGVTSSFANAFGPLVSSSQVLSDKIYSKRDMEQAVASFLLTFVVVSLPLFPYILVNDLVLARMISVMTGLVLLFIFGVQHAQLKHYSPLLYGFMMVAIGFVSAYICSYIAHILM
ncbi:MAG: VIT1/CCC1 transporter family protein [Candidatus Moraniibacteriota bacterium]|jgi:VIT1/CCC1 family predicted Fe2+/Mn2+ transporter